MVTRRGNTSGTTIRGALLPQAQWSLDWERRVRVTGEDSTEEQTVDDAVYLIEYISDEFNEANILTNIDDPSVLFNGNISYETTDEAIATVNASGVMTYVDDGTVRVKATNTIDNSFKYSEEISITKDLATTSSGIQEWVDGSLAKECSDAVDSRLSGAEIRIFDTQNHTGQTYVRNPDVWCSDLDLTCISPWNSRGAHTRAGTLITKDAIIHAEHYPLSIGNTVRFVTTDNDVVDRTISAIGNIGPSNANDGYATDLRVAVLDSEVPSGIVPCKVAASGISDYFAHLSDGIPSLCLDQEEKALVTDLRSLSTSRAAYKVPTDETRASFYEAKISGDSGNPAFLIIDGELVLFTVWTFGGAGSGPNIAANITAINEKLTDLGSAYSVTEVVLTGYPTY